MDVDHMDVAEAVSSAADEHREATRRALPRIGALIGDHWRYDLGGPEITHIDPGTGAPTASFTVADQQTVDDVVAAARSGLATWRALPAGQRGKLIQALGSVISENAAELAALTALETGTPISMTSSRMSTVPASWFDYYAGWCDKLTGDTFPESLPGTTQFTVYEPVGVVAKLVTWNSPIGGIQMSLPAALAAGCSVVLRPPELAPFTITRFGQLCLEAGLPPGVVSVLPAGPDGAEALVRHPDVAAVSFTGGPQVARHIQRAAADTLTPLVLELGGKSANIVFEDADVDTAVRHASIIHILSGQGCALPTRLLVHASRYDEVVEAVVDSLSKVIVGDPFDPATMTGPVISEAAKQRIDGMIDRAVADGARLALGGSGTSRPGFFVEPTVLVDVDVNSEIAQREVFGPVLSVLPFHTEDEAVSLANATPFGLVAYVHTRDISRAMRMTRQLVAGNVSINGGPAPSGAHAPFGGLKESGYGREGGREGVLEFTSVKTVSIAL